MSTEKSAQVLDGIGQAPAGSSLARRGRACSRCRSRSVTLIIKAPARGCLTGLSCQATVPVVRSVTLTLQGFAAPGAWVFNLLVRAFLRHQPQFGHRQPAHAKA